MSAPYFETSPKEMFFKNIPTCKDKTDFDAKWAMAQQWVAKNIRWKIRLVTDALIETYEAPTGVYVEPALRREVAVRITKVPKEGGVTQILYEGWCLEEPCFLGKWSKAWLFNRTLNEGTQ